MKRNPSPQHFHSAIMNAIRIIELSRYAHQSLWGWISAKEHDSGASLLIEPISGPLSVVFDALIQLHLHLGIRSISRGKIHRGPSLERTDTERVTHMDTILMYTIIIVALCSFILGLIVGVVLGRPNIVS